MLDQGRRATRIAVVMSQITFRGCNVAISNRLSLFVGLAGHDGREGREEGGQDRVGRVVVELRALDLGAEESREGAGAEAVQELSVGLLAVIGEWRQSSADTPTAWIHAETVLDPELFFKTF